MRKETEKEQIHTQDLERALIKLASICDMTPINKDLRSMATMYLNALHEAYKSNYIKYLEDKISNSIDYRVLEKELEKMKVKTDKELKDRFGIEGETTRTDIMFSGYYNQALQDIKEKLS